MKDYYEELYSIVEVALSHDAIQHELSAEEIDTEIQFQYERMKKKNKIVTEDDIKRLRAEIYHNFSHTIIREDSVIIDTSVNSTWWTDKSKKNTYYTQAYEKFLEHKSKYNKDTISRIAERSDKIMNYLFDPTIQNNDIIKRFGIVMGAVQAGKTSNYIELICKAADAGYKVIVVIAGTSNLLRQQTQIRICQGFVGRTDKNKDKDKKEKQEFTCINTVAEYHVKGNPDDHDNWKSLEEMRPYSFTTERLYGDFVTKSKEATECTSLTSSTVPFLFVIKKETSVLRQMLNFFKKKHTDEFSMLVIDDEADNASINTKIDDKTRTAINKGIRELLLCFRKSAYIAFTATPFANVFIRPLYAKKNNEKDLFPKDFMVCLARSEDYFGPQTIFSAEEAEESRYIRTLEPANGKNELPNQDWERFFPLSQRAGETFSNFEAQEGLPKSLTEALIIFFYNIAIRNARGRSNSHNSMLINVSHLTDMHGNDNEGIKHRVIEFIEKEKNKIELYSTMYNTYEYNTHIKPYEKLYENHIASSKQISNQLKYKDINILYPPFKDIIKCLPSIMHNVLVAVANKKTNELSYSNLNQTNVIAIGGFGLSRGFTLEGLSISYFIRNTKLCDTLLQMGRWFGYRYDYQDICRIFMTDELYERFKQASEASESLVSSVCQMQKEHKRPENFLLTIAQHPASHTLLTAKNKMRTASIDKGVCLDGEIREHSSYYRDEIEIVKNYFQSCEKFISSLGPNNHNLWTDIHANKISKFIEECPLLFSYEIDNNKLIEYILKNSDVMWRVLLPSSAEEKNNSLCHISGLEIKKFMRYNRNGEGVNEKLRFSVSTITMEKSTLLKNEAQKLKEDYNRSDIRSIRSQPVLMLILTDIHEYCKKENREEYQEKIKICKTFPMVSLSFAGDKTHHIFTKPINSYIFNDDVKQELINQLTIDQKEQMEEDDD